LRRGGCAHQYPSECFAGHVVRAAYSERSKTVTLPQRRDFCFGSKFSTPRLRETFFNRCGAFAIERHWARSRFDNPKQHFRGLVLIRWRELTDLGNRTIEELGHWRIVSN